MRLFEATFFAWFYMRFYMYRDLSETAGDQSSNFSLVSFLPTAANGYVEPVADASYMIAVKLGLFTEHGTAATGTMLDKSTLYDRKK